MKIAPKGFQKHASTLCVAMVTKGWKRFENYIFVLKINSLQFSESFKSLAQGVFEIFEEVYRGGGGGHKENLFI